MKLNLYKKTAITFVLMFSINSVSAQVRIFNSSTNPAVVNTPVFLDASSNTVANGNASNGKGLLFPRTNLTTMTSFPADGGTGIPSNYPTRFDGMIVYNTATSGVAGVGTTQGTLSPGYWYYDNKSATNTGGTWKPLTTAATSPVVNIGTLETTTNTQIAGSQVYAVKGTFTTTGTSTAITLPTLGSTASLYSITIFKKSATGNGAKKVYAKDLFSYDPATGAAVTGSPSISVVYPLDTYDYVMEYMKN